MKNTTLKELKEKIANATYTGISKAVNNYYNEYGRSAACALYNTWAIAHNLGEGAMYECVRDMFTPDSNYGYGDKSVEMTNRIHEWNDYLENELSTEYYEKVEKFLRTVRTKAQKQVTRTERGWQGHFCGKCEYHRNTLLECDGVAVVVSTVGMLFDHLITHKYEEVGAGRYFETMVFLAKDDKYKDADTSEEVWFDSTWAIPEIDELAAEKMHEDVVKEISERLLKGEIDN